MARSRPRPPPRSAGVAEAATSYVIDGPSDEDTLLARVEVIDATDARLLRFVRAATVPTTLQACADLAIDRVVLLEQASPWHYLDGGSSTSSAGASRPPRTWQRHYVRAYAAHYARVVEDCDHLLRDAEGLMARLATLEHLNGAGSLGEPEGAAAIGALRSAVATLMAMPAEPDPHAATTAGVHLGAGNPAAEAFRVAAADVDRALEARLRRLSASLAACALTQDDDLAAIRHAIAVSEVDHLDRVLDDRLTARIDGLLRGAARSPLALVARQFPEVTRDNLDAAVAEFRRAALRAIELAPDGRTALGSISPAVEAAG